MVYAKVIQKRFHLKGRTIGFRWQTLLHVSMIDSGSGEVPEQHVTIISAIFIVHTNVVYMEKVLLALRFWKQWQISTFSLP